VAGACVSQEPQRGGDGVGELAHLRLAVGIVELGENERVDPFGVRPPGDVARQLRADVLDEVVSHAGELAQMAVVREAHPRTGKWNGCRLDSATVAYSASVTPRTWATRHVGSSLADRFRRLRSKPGGVVTR
jgi:hypothetical protein